LHFPLTTCETLPVQRASCFLNIHSKDSRALRA